MLVTVRSIVPIAPVVVALMENVSTILDARQPKLRAGGRQHPRQVEESRSVLNRVFPAGDGGLSSGAW